MWGGDILFEDGKLRLEARLDLLEMTDVYLRKSSTLLKHNRIVKNVVPSSPFFFWMTIHCILQSNKHHLHHN